MNLSQRRSLDRRFAPPSKYVPAPRRDYLMKGGRGGLERGAFEGFRAPRRYMSGGAKQFGRKRALMRLAETGLKMGFNLSPLKKGLIAMELLDAGLTLAELGVGYYLYDKDWKQNEWYRAKEVGPYEWIIPPGYSCMSYKPGICGGSGADRTIGQQQIIKFPIACHTWHYCGQGIQPNPPASANVFFAGPVNTIGYFGIELVVQYPWTGLPIPKPQWAPGIKFRTLPMPQPLAPPRPVIQEAYQPPPNPRAWPQARKLPRYRVPAFEADTMKWAERGPSSHARLPPRGEKERKHNGRLRQVLSAAARLYSSATEAKDAIDQIHAALPKKYQVKGGAFAKARAIYEHFDKLDMAKAAANLAANHYEDKVIGKLHSYGKKSPYGSSLGHPLHNPFW